tara:strand:+ start:78 stop:296 length:219 start_codon:yes stop_codon:yes gene_type:complete
MKAIGDYAIIEVENSVSATGIQIKTDGMGLVHSCPKYPEIEGKMVLFDDRHRSPTHDNFIFIKTEYLLGVIE